MFRSDGGRTSISLGPETCTIDANAGRFQCDSLVAGEYTLYFEVEGVARSEPTQTAIIRYNVQPSAKAELVVQLQNAPQDWSNKRPFNGAAGILDWGDLCAIAADGRPAIQVRAWVHGRAGGACYYMIALGSTRRRLPRDRYKVSAFEAAYVPSNNSYLGHSSKFEAALMRYEIQHGTAIELDVGRTVKPAPPVMTTSKLISIGLSSLRADR
jgi:hypothetical protein